MGSDAVDAEGALPDALLSSTRWPGADALHGGTGVTANVRAAAEHHRHRGLERTRQPSHGPTTRSVAPTLAARLRAAPEALEARLHAWARRLRRPLLLMSSHQRRIADA
ncbi:Os07g0266900 [Oryza sativa Japonica Group]|uniref:Os07g0266900 protein n=1 Tax=Oryza sativa subsp. japonica TaxID=39947 RepID=A0A0P0X4X7_ORYSJ|nr:Os07g0266900 [Oryza sativa Japonica Group]